jgi:prophage antirepressor-like protein
MKSLQAYQFQSHNLRVVPDENGDPWFIAKDVFDILGYSNSRDMTKKLCRDAGVSIRYIPQLSNTYTLIDEGNLYRLIIKSNKPESEAFESWVCDDMLPTIRKTGSYGLPHDAKATIQALQSELLKARPRLHKALKLTHAGFSKAESGRMLGVGETTMRREYNTLKACGFPVSAAGTQLDLFGGE